MKNKAPFFIILCLAVFALFIPMGNYSEPSGMKGEDVVWMLLASAFVLLMTPGLAYFYGGMVSSKNVISTMLQSFIAMGVVTIVWVVVGFSLAFGESFHGLIGNPMSYFLFQNVLEGKPWSLAPTIPMIVFAMFQLKFAVITPALVTGSMAERVNFRSYVLFTILFTVFIYAPLAHWTWHPEGIFFKMGVLDFAGGTVVHMSAGLAALMGAIYLKKRTTLKEGISQSPANVPYVLLGTGLLWFGWFGFNGGSAFAVNLIAANAFATTTTSAAAAGITWVVLDSALNKKVSAMGFAMGVVVGLVAITPAAGYVRVSQALFFGVLSSCISNILVHLKSKINLDDTLDVFPCHGVGGMVGMLLTGIFANKKSNPFLAEEGAFYGNTSLLFKHVLALCLVCVFVLVMSFFVFKLTDWIMPMRVSEEDEAIGLDKSQHGEFLLITELQN